MVIQNTSNLRPPRASDPEPAPSCWAPHTRPSKRVRSRSANQICPPTTPWWRYLRRYKSALLFFPTVYRLAIRFRTYMMSHHTLHVPKKCDLPYEKCVSQPTLQHFQQGSHKLLCRRVRHSVAWSAPGAVMRRREASTNLFPQIR